LNFSGDLEAPGGKNEEDLSCLRSKPTTSQ
jgi:hypothetical protein